MSKITGWIQSCDYSSKQLGVLDADAAIRYFHENDWKTQMNLEKKMVEAGDDCCPSGMGLVHPDGFFVHICPEAEGRNMIHYNAPMRKRVLGLFPVKDNTMQSVVGKNDAETDAMIRLFFEGRFEKLSELTRE